MTLQLKTEPKMHTLTQWAGRAVALLQDDVDTDQIIPARYLKDVTFDNLGSALFYDQRFGSDGKSKPIVGPDGNAHNHPLNDPRHAGASILLVSRNFGCGSSREHAPRALMRFGFKVIIGISFAEIFASNCASIGLAAVTVTPDVMTQLVESVQQNPLECLSVDLEKKTIFAIGKTFGFSIPAATQAQLVHGTWDSLGTLLAEPEAIDAIVHHLPYVQFNAWMRNAQEVRVV